MYRLVKCAISANKINLIIGIIVALMLLGLSPAPLIAFHETEAPCEEADSSGVSLGGAVGGLFVPVREFTLENINREIEIDVDAARQLLFLLCLKEFELDHTIQHAWRRIIGEFVEETRDWVNRALGGNPIFLTNQNTYYQLVDLAVMRVLLQDIKDSNISETGKRTISVSIISEMFDTPFPYTGVDELVPEGVADALAKDFYNAGSFKRWNKLLFNPTDNEIGLLSIVRDELNRRQKLQIEFEREKLAWGRGFFSYELCDLAIYTVNPEDRRNCRIATPGSLIQDEVSFVFGSALRQMELNDEYEEWIAPNTAAALNDILSARGFNDDDSRGNFNANPVPSNVGVGQIGSPFELDSFVELDIGSQNDDLPVEYNVVIDFEFEGQGPDSKNIFFEVFGDFLNPEEFIN